MCHAFKPLNYLGLDGKFPGIWRRSLDDGLIETDALFCPFSLIDVAKIITSIFTCVIRVEWILCQDQFICGFYQFESQKNIFRILSNSNSFTHSIFVRNWNIRNFISPLSHNYNFWLYSKSFPTFLSAQYTIFYKITRTSKLKILIRIRMDW